MNGILKNWMIRAGSRLPELTAAAFLIMGLAAAGWIMAGNPTNVSGSRKPAVVKSASSNNTVEFAGEMGAR